VLRRQKNCSHVTKFEVQTTDFSRSGQLIRKNIYGAGSKLSNNLYF
jgi:hypothetical protein